MSTHYSLTSLTRNQTIQVNATVTPDLVMVNVNQGELANVTVTESVVTVYGLYQQ